jgi:hypothetical protein
LDVSSSEGGTGIVVGPIIDSTAEVLYIFAASDGSAGCSGGADCSAVYELPVDFPEDDTGLEATVGSSTISGKAPSPLYLGALDSAYENSTNATGNLYVCGNTGGPPVLYQVAIEDGVLGGTTAGPVLSTSSIIPCSSVTDIRNPNVTGGATEWLFTSVENGGISNGCASGGCVFNFKDTPWLPSTSYSVGQEILDDHFQIQVVKTAGTSGTTAPFWSGTLGGTTVDSTVRWLDQGQLSAITLSAWVAHHSYTKNSKILDANGNVELVTSAGTKASGGTVPTFSTIAGVTTSDGTAGLVWTNVGALGTSAAPQSGGTSGIIVDNTVGSGTLAGASQVYFSTLGSQTCGTSGTGGCAVQASQAGLQ